MSNKSTDTKKESVYTKEQILASNRYANKRDICKAVLPDIFNGTLSEADSLIEKFMKGKVN